MFFRVIPEDYDEWAELGNDQWAFVRLLSYFRKLETYLDYGGDDFHGSVGPIQVRRYKHTTLGISPNLWRQELKR